MARLIANGLTGVAVTDIEGCGNKSEAIIKERPGGGLGLSTLGLPVIRLTSPANPCPCLESGECVFDRLMDEQVQQPAADLLLMRLAPLPSPPGGCSLATEPSPEP